ncbi:hypothetical protein Aple_016470 [Acrocarpospora pleiomorpha]|uniref:Uncharacterized protein n=1 Tax=Acrocarpospora pleiomorpha TaxID=90975 RepID=A0A5M3XDB6_9ACTN|nr:hypothetical protein [Acrocarpospora pleiomorpha]GES18752.1 hypothetical protein Aple_016470 [Acrocarpospora pleiomorpha]
MTAGKIDPNRDELYRKLLEINVWAMLLIVALVLERASDAIISVTSVTQQVDTKVWAAVFVMGLVFGLLLATTVGILALHVRFQAPYRYWYIILDNIFVTVPLYIAVRFSAASISKSGASVRLNEDLFRIGAAMIAVALAFLFTRDLIVLPKIRDKLSVPPLVAVSALHLLGALLFVLLAIVPGAVLYVAVLGSIGLGLFFAGMAAIPVISIRFAADPTTVSGP